VEVGCNQQPANYRSKSTSIEGWKCNWSVRLEHFISAILGFDGVRVTNIANGGTNTAQAVNLIRY